MNFEDLPADELAVFDSVCLAFERDLRDGREANIESVVAGYVQTHGARDEAHLKLLRAELDAIAQELQSKQQQRSSPPPFQPKRPGSDVDADTASGSVEIPPVASTPPVVSIGPYAIGEVLARGGMGVIYRAVDTRLDRKVAIKMLGFPNLHEQDPKRIELIDRFEREARSVAALSHPNIVELFDVGVTDGNPYAVMEFLNGVTLADQFDSGAMSADETRQVGMQIAGALATAHAAGVIHRDLKPQNVMVVESTDSGDGSLRIKLVDFGLSRVSGSSLMGLAGKSDKTRLGTILGTPGYMSPEQARGEEATSAADIFGLGCILYEAYFGVAAFPGDTPADRLAMTLTGNAEFPADCESIDSGLCALIAETLAKSPEQRPAATDIYQRLRQPSMSHAAALNTANGDSLLGDGRSNRRTLAAFIGGGLLVGLAGYWLMPKSRIGGVQSIAVLTFSDALGGTEKDRSGSPLGGRMITDGEAIAAALVNELSRLDGFAIRPFRPRMAETPAEFKALGDELEVDALVTGSYGIGIEDGNEAWVLKWDLVRADDGSVLVGGTFWAPKTSEAIGDRLLDQSRLASQIAQRLGEKLIANADRARPPNNAAYSCMVKGSVQADPDSTAGLKESLHCFAMAESADGNMTEVLAAYAVAAFSLAARSNQKDATNYVQEAIERVRRARKLDRKLPETQLAESMLDWQILFDFDKARIQLGMLVEEYTYNPQFQHQYGLLSATLGNRAEARRALDHAVAFNPTSVFLKVDRCRVDWFFGNDQDAFSAAQQYREQYQSDEAQQLLRGLTIDIYEQRERFDLASEELGWAVPETQRQAYFRRREETLADHPYGFFGDLLNRAICTLRSNPAAAEDVLVELRDAQSPMFPLVVNRHPAFSPVRRIYSDATRLRPSFLVPVASSA